MAPGPGTAAAFEPTRRAAIVSALALLALSPGRARAEPWLRDYVVIYTEPTLVPVLRAIGAAFRPQGGPAIVLAAPTAQNLALLAHGTQDDLLIALASFLPQAEAAGLIAPGARPLWRNRLVLAAAGVGATRDFDPAGIPALLGGGRLAYPDATAASSLDGPATVARLGLGAVIAERGMGAVDSLDVADLLRRRQAALGLCYETDIGPGLYAAMRIAPAAHDPVLYTVAKASKAWSRYGDAFVAFLGTERARSLAQAAGLEMVA